MVLVRASVLFLLLLFCNKVFAQQPIVIVTEPARHILEQGKRWKVGSIATGKIHPILQQYAESGAQRQAALDVQGHHEWDRRFHELYQRMPGYGEFSEIAAESWPWEDGNLPLCGHSMFDSWRQSPGHWSVANGPCAAFGYSMARGRSGKWYGCGITAQLSTIVIQQKGLGIIRQPQVFKVR